VTLEQIMDVVELVMDRTEQRQAMIAEQMLAANERLDGVDIEERAQRLTVVQEAMTWLGTPWHHQARVKGAGVDCGQILAAVFEDAGILPHVEPGDYPQDFMMHRDEERFRQTLEAYASKVESDPLPGDIVLYRYGRVISHGGIVVAWPQIVHSYAPAGEVVLDDAEANQDLAPRFMGVWSPWGGDR
jgi:cell wall-associated NlpC family hydrolase